MLDSILLPSLAFLAGTWAVVSAVRRQRAIAAGAATSAAVLTAAWLASSLGPWLEGGWGMGVLAVTGSYALGAAVASRRSSSPGPRRAALVALAVTVVASVGFYAQALAVVDEAVRHAPPDVAQRIREAGAAEAARTVQLGGLLGALALALLLTPRRRDGARLGAGSGTKVEREARRSQSVQLAVS